MSRITIDPVTRIEGHLRIDVEVENGKVRDAWSSGQMWRGVELILRSPAVLCILSCCVVLCCVVLCCVVLCCVVLCCVLCCVVLCCVVLHSIV